MKSGDTFNTGDVLAHTGGGGGEIGGGGVGSGGAGASAQLHLSCSVRGLGPRFKISLDLHQRAQAGAQPLFNVSVAFLFSAAAYHMERPLLVLPLLLPGVHYFPEVDITCVDAAGAADAVRVLVCCGGGGGVPALATIVAMPLSAVQV